jgi:hypothetical protein
VGVRTAAAAELVKEEEEEEPWGVPEKQVRDVQRCKSCES